MFELCVDAYNSPSNPPSTVEATLYAIKLPSSGTTGEAVPIPGADVFASSNSGYTSACVSGFSYPFHTVADIDGQGQANVTFQTYVQLPTSNGLGAVRIFWRRRISPAPGSPSFGDVPASDAAYQYIEALVASGVTAGCGGGNYCPDSALTRRQMAVFLSKALGLHFPN
jgi:S-layer homology domain